MTNLPPSDSFAELFEDRSSSGARSGRRSPRRRRRGRRLLGGLARGVFWALVLGGVFVLGLGYGQTIGSEDERRTDTIEVSDELGTVEATLPTTTITETVTVAARPKPRAARPAAAGAGAQRGA